MWSPLNMSVPPAVWLDAAHKDAWPSLTYPVTGGNIDIWNDRSGNGHYFEQPDDTGDTPSEPAALPKDYYSRTISLFEGWQGEHISSHRLVPQMQVGTGDFLVAVVMVTTTYSTDHMQIVQQKSYDALGSGNAGILLRKYKNDATDHNTIRGQVGNQKVDVKEGVENMSDWTFTMALFYRKDGYMYSRRDGDAIDSLDLGGSPNDVNDYRDATYHSTYSPSPATISFGNKGDTQDDEQVWTGSLMEAVLVGGTVDMDDIHRLEGYLGHKWATPTTDPFDHYLTGGWYSSFTSQNTLLTRFDSDHPYASVMPAGWFGINTASGDNSLNGRPVGELSGDCGWLISDVQEIQRG